VAAIGKEGFDLASTVPLNIEFAFTNALLLCEEATKELISGLQIQRVF
jgi:hypothetical protein